MYRFLKKEATTSINGVFIMIVFISHLRTYMQLVPWLEHVMAGFSQLMVAMFLFYSGFGVMESIHNKGMDYVKRIPVHRVLHVLAMLFPVVLIYALLDLILGIPFTMPQFFLSFIAWLNLGNSNWYIFVIVCLYLITWLAWIGANAIMKSRTTKSEVSRDRLGLVFTLILSAGLILVLRIYTPDYYYNTISAYLFGMLFSQSKDTILRICGFDKVGKLAGSVGIVKYILATVLMLGVTIGLRIYIQHDWRASLFLLMTVFFCMFIVLISHLIPFPDKVFHWLGAHLFEIYILMRIPMIALLRVPGWEQGGLWYALSCLVITIVLAWGYHAVITGVTKRVKKAY